MSIFTLFAPDGGAIALDCVTDISKSRSATTTQSTIFNGATMADHYRGQLPVFNVNGVVAALKSRVRDALHSPVKFSKLIDDYIDNETLFTFVDDTEGVLGNHKNVVILDYNITRNVKYSDGLLVSMTLKKLDVSNSVQKTTITKPKAEVEATVGSPEKRTTDGKTTNNTPELKQTVARQTGISIEEALSRGEE